MDYEELIHNMFTYHAPNELQTARIGEVREAAGMFAGHIDEQVPDGPDKTLALRSLHQAVMHANYAIVTGG